ncbi:hypothetical protein QBC40DRAFT_284122 [Triangularia verruculosa]|uniref:CorA-like transporter domain-containing protein n=1 Tax=Triangularia verruculosa TaxID=2587418 RepID=A0AAN6XI66_9PEZI|nr:hypothetical protein QBC40DRAFT_284122 [Triangularia verruculosa]
MTTHGSTQLPSTSVNPAQTPLLPPSPAGSFDKSLAEWHTWPANLISRTALMNPSTLRSYRSQLDAAELDLLADRESEVEVRFRDLEVDGKALAKKNVHSEEKLRDWLGIVKKPNTANSPPTLVSTTKRDPKSRFIYIYANHSRDRLRITKSMLTMILSFHQVMPEYLDFLRSFGLQPAARDLYFSGFRRQIALKKPPVAPNLDALGRSTQQYQIAYNVKGVTAKSETEWSIRNAAIYHKYDVVSDRAVWIVTKGGDDLYESYKELTDSGGRPEDRAFNSAEHCFLTSLAPHLLFCRWAVDDWRGYLRWLEHKVEKESLLGVLGPREPGQRPKRYQARDVQHMQYWQERTSQVVVVLEGNIEVMLSLGQFYQGLAHDDRFPRRGCAGEIADFVSQLDVMIAGLRNDVSRANALVKTTADRKELIIQHRQNEAEERMHRLNKNMEEETLVVRIITLVTLVYLPATFVSTLFSTDIIKYQDDEFPNGKFSEVAMIRWIQVTVPLTIMTLIAAWVGKWWASRASGDEREAIERQDKPLMRWRYTEVFLPWRWFGRNTRPPAVSLPMNALPP